MSYKKPTAGLSGATYIRGPIWQRLLVTCQLFIRYVLSLRSTVNAGTLGTRVSCGDVAACLGLVALFYAIVYGYLSLPVVEKRAASRECVRVLYADGTVGTCTALPDRYVTVLVR